MTNRATLHGTLDRDPEFRTFANGGSVANLRVSTVETWQQGGETKSRTEWHSAAVFSDRALEVLRTARKGDAIEIDGKIETRSWTDQAGNKRYTTEVVVRPAPGHGVKLTGTAPTSSPPPATASAPASSAAPEPFAF